MKLAEAMRKKNAEYKIQELESKAQVQKMTKEKKHSVALNEKLNKSCDV